MTGWGTSGCGMGWVGLAVSPPSKRGAFEFYFCSFPLCLLPSFLPYLPGEEAVY